MKKLLLSALLVSAAFALRAADTFPGWGGKDPAPYKAAADAATRINTKANNLVMYHFLERKAKSFDELCKIVDEVCDDLYEKPVVNAERKLTLKKMFAVCRGQFLPECVAFAEKNPSWYDIYLGNVIRGDKAKAYAFLLTAYKRYFYNYPADIHIKTLKNLAAWGKESKVETLKEDFAKLKPHIDRISAKNPEKCAELVKTYEELVKEL